MNEEKKSRLISLLAAVALMFVWIPVAFALIGGREIAEFSQTDRVIFICFIVVEVTTMAAVFFFAFRLGRLNSAEAGQRANEDKTVKLRGYLLLLFSCAVTFVFALSGSTFGKGILSEYIAVSGGILAVCGFIAVALFLLNPLLRRRYVAKLNSMKVGERQNYILSHRESAVETAGEKLALLKKIRLLTGLYAVFVGVLSFPIAFFSGVLFGTGLNIAVSALSVILLFASVTRIRFPVGEKVFREDDSYVGADEYPELYAIAAAAAAEMKCEGKIRIALLGDCNVGIAEVDGSYSVQLGVIFLNIVSGDELYNVLLHEFSHVSDENRCSIKENAYHGWLCTDTVGLNLASLTSLLFCYPDCVYSFEFNIYRYSVSVLNEEAADRAIAVHGDVRAAASALIKLNDYDFFRWENDIEDFVSAYASEEPQKDVVNRQIVLFNKSLAVRTGEWNKIIGTEILSRNATHPTLKMRLEAFGVSGYEISDAENPPAYREECRRALENIEEIIYRNRLKTYAEERKSQYTEPKSEVDKWEAAGKPVTAEGYADIVQNLRWLGRAHEAEELCDRVIVELRELPEAAVCFACYIKGVYMLHRYDPAGIDMIYRAIENNSNYIEEGLDIIGTFCCMTGRQTELDEYRKKAVELSQQQKDIYSKTACLNKKDNLSGEQLPDGMLDDILGYIRSLDDGCIQSVYLVRKTITEDFFTSVFVIRFTDACRKDKETEERRGEIFHKVFRYLDSCSDWQFSLFEYEDVKHVKFSAIPQSLVYMKDGK